MPRYFVIDFMNQRNNSFFPLFLRLWIFLLIRQFQTAAAAAAYGAFKGSSKAAAATLDIKRTRLQNTLVDLAIQPQRVARVECGWGEELVVLVTPPGQTGCKGACPIPLPPTPALRPHSYPW